MSLNETLSTGINQNGKVRRFKIGDRGQLQITTIRLHEKDMQDLKDFFDVQGMNLSTGIRHVMRTYMIKEGLLDLSQK